MPVKRLFDFLDKYAGDEAATGSIFNYFRNTMPVVAVGAASACYSLPPDLNDLIDHLAAIAFAVISPGLFISRS